MDGDSTAADGGVDADSTATGAAGAWRSHFIGVNAGLMGSENTLTGLRRGARGYITSGGVRDTDEVILQKVPFWAKIIAQSMVQGRLQYAGRNEPVCVGGVTVQPGDVVVADGDGVIVVPAARVQPLQNSAG